MNNLKLPWRKCLALVPEILARMVGVIITIRTKRTMTMMMDYPVPIRLFPPNAKVPWVPHPCVAKFPILRLVARARKLRDEAPNSSETVAAAPAAAVTVVIANDDKHGLITESTFMHNCSWTIKSARHKRYLRSERQLLRGLRPLRPLALRLP